MTEAELMELLALYMQNNMLGFSLYLTITFAYLVVAFIAGSRLSRFQAIAASALYLFAAFSTAMSTLVNLNLVNLVTAQSEALLQLNGPPTNFWIIYMGTVMFVGIIVSLYFLFDVRRRADT